MLPSNTGSVTYCKTSKFGAQIEADQKYRIFVSMSDFPCIIKLLFILINYIKKFSIKFNLAKGHFNAFQPSALISANSADGQR